MRSSILGDSMTRTKRALIALACALTGATAPVATSAGSPAPAAQVVAAKSCSAGYSHAVTPGGHKCLRAGQFCSHRRGYQRVYHRYGLHCKANGHLGYR
jgi:hypothetical protein